MYRTYVAFLLTLVCFAACTSEPKPQTFTVDSSGNVSLPGLPERPAPNAPGVLTVDTITAAVLPPELKHRGTVSSILSWNDANGHNILITTATDRKPEAKPEYTEEESYAELLAWQYVRRDTGWALLWDLADGVRHCGYDMTLGFLPRSTAITDLDGDDTTETTLVYELACRSDVSPAEMKLIMHEDTLKLGLRGNRFIDPVLLGGEEYAGIPKPGPGTICCIDDLLMTTSENFDDHMKLFGRYRNERDFSGAPSSFLEFARQQWLMHVVERVGGE